jgi:uncharacterized membrane protein YozB (DUF420 family)
MNATMSQTIDLILQFGILIMTAVGFYSFKKRKLLWHAQLMTIALAMIITSFLLVMLPALLMSYTTFNDPANPVFDWSSIIHIPFGILGLFLGGFLVVRWARNEYTLKNMKATILMRATMFCWVINIILGTTIFFTMTG